MERENFVDVKGVEKRFTDKLESQEQSYLKLEQESLEMAQDYDKKIKKIKKKNSADIDALLKEFTTNLQKVQNEFNISDQTADSLKDYYKDKIHSQDEQHENLITDMKDEHHINKTEKEILWVDREKN